jgi:hypothetical protein
VKQRTEEKKDCLMPGRGRQRTGVTCASREEIASHEYELIIKSAIVLLSERGWILRTHMNVALLFVRRPGTLASTVDKY